MTVYVDNAFIPYGRMKMCHLMADTTEELLQMVDAIGVNPKWIQKRGTSREHFDIALIKRQLAIENGTIPISQKDMGRFSIAKQHGFKWRPGDDVEKFNEEYRRHRGLTL